MRLICMGLGFVVAAGLLSPTGAFAQLVVNPERLNGTFDFEDKVVLDKNTLEFEVDGRELGIEGQVRDLADTEVVTIRYRTDFPNKSAADDQSASVGQDTQVLVTLEVTDGVTVVYAGQAAPNKCKVQAKIRDAEENDPDDPDKSQASFTCDLGRDWSDLEDDLAAPPPAPVLEAVEAAFETRKDVKVDTSSGKLQIKHNGEPVPLP